MLTDNPEIQIITAPSTPSSTDMPTDDGPSPPLTSPFATQNGQQLQQQSLHQLATSTNAARAHSVSEGKHNAFISIVVPSPTTSDHLVSRQTPWSAPMTGISGVSIEVHLGHDDRSATQNHADYPLSSDVWAETVVQSPILGDSPPTIGSSQPTIPLMVGVKSHDGPQRRSSKAVRMERGHAQAGSGTSFGWKGLVNDQVCLGA